MESLADFFGNIIAFILIAIFAIWVISILMGFLSPIKDGLVAMLRYLKGKAETNDMASDSAITQADIDEYSEASKSISNPIVKRIKRTVAMLAALVLIISFVALAIVFIHQIYQWLRLGEWHTVTFHEYLAWLGIDVSAILPTEWHGITKVLAWILELPLVVMLLALCSVCFIPLAIFDEDE